MQGGLSRQQGKLLQRDTIYPHTSQRQAEEARRAVVDLCARFEVEAIAVGNGTAGRETESFLGRLSCRAGYRSTASTRAGRPSTRHPRLPGRNSPTRT
jgi:transcriptional accessory protein Tex/SPT6